MYRLDDVAVVDPRDGAVTAHQNVWISGGRITRISAGVGRDNAEQSIDGGGRFLVPGFNDMHAHPLNLDDPGAELRLMLAFGITGYRQMSGTPELLRNRAERARDGDDEVPRLLATAGAVLTPMNAGTVATAVEQVRRQAEAGADFIKAGFISPEIYFAVQAEADRVGIEVLGHLPGGIDPRAASRAGFRSIEHVGPGLGVLAGCSCHEDHLRTASAKSPFRAPPFRIPFADRIAMKLIGRIVLNPALQTTPATLAAMRDGIDSFDEAMARELARQFAADDTWSCPTLIRIRAQELCDDPAFAADPDLKYVTAREREAWSGAATKFRSKFDDTQREVFAEMFALQQRMVKLLDEEGAPLLAGTDAVGAVWVVAGASLHDEFDLLAGAGLTPLRILQAATIEPARFLHREADAGTVEPGQEADLVLLDADPTATTANLHTVSAVVRAGRYHSPGDLAALREQAVGR